MIYFHYWINKLSSERSTVHRMPKEVRKVAGSKYQQSKTVWNRLVLWGQFVLFGLFSHEKFLLKVCLKNYIVHLWLTAIDDTSKWSGTFYIYMVSIDVRIVIGCGDVMGWWWNKFICRPVGKFRSHMLLLHWSYNDSCLSCISSRKQTSAAGRQEARWGAREPCG